MPLTRAHPSRGSACVRELALRVFERGRPIRVRRFVVADEHSEIFAGNVSHFHGFRDANI